jgi:ATP-binding cassette subfamily B multidrug efflux pump
MSMHGSSPMAGRGPMGGRGGMGFGGRRGGPGMMMKGEKPRDFKGTMKRLVRYLSAYKVAISIVLVFAIASTIFTILGPKILGKATTKLFEGVMGQIAGSGVGIDFDYIGSIILIMVGLYLLASIFGYIQGWLMSGVSMKITYRFRRDISQKINRMPLKYFDGTNHGEVLSRVTNDVDTISQTLNQSLTQIITSVTTLVGVLIMMFTINWLMTLVTLLIVPLSLVIIGLIINKSQKYFKQQQDYLGHVNGHVEEMYGGHVVMKAFNGEEKSVAQFDKINNVLYGSAWKSQFLSGLMMPVMTFVGNLGYVAVCILGGWLAITNAITIGDIQAFIQYVRSFTQPITQISNISNVLQQTAASAERVFEFLNESEEIAETDQSVQLQTVAGRVEFKHVQFGYNPDKIIIKDFSASVTPGQKIAIVGPTGAGKTTIVKLLMRFYDVNSGAIEVDGHDIRDFSRHDLRKMFAMVLQDTWLYNGTIMENIRYGRSTATDAQVVAAAKAAHVDHFVRTLPDGYQMVLNEEASNVSQGQMQLLTIARAILADPRILILDEATSSVDTRTEVLIQKAMDNLMKNRTSFVIAHRLSTIRDANMILVMRDGDIVEQGMHEELLEKGGFYAELYNSQFAVQPVGVNGNGNGNGKDHGNGHKPAAESLPEIRSLSPADQRGAAICLKQAYKALKLGKNSEARQLAQDTLRLCPSLEDPYLILAAIAEDPQESVEYLKKALEIDPASQQAQKGLAWAERRLKASLMQKSI